jgi:hypothetical protein
MRLPVRPAGGQLLLDDLLAHQPAQDGPGAGFVDGTVDSLGTMMLWVFMNETGLRTAVMAQF